MSRGDIIVETSGLTIGYVSHGRMSPVMKDIAVKAHHGELVALIGRNGSGKSTLLRTLVALQPRLEGTVRLRGTDLDSISSSERPRVVSFTSTEPVAARNFSVRELVALGRFPYTNWIGTLAGDDDRAIEEALEVTGLQYFAGRRIDSISDGERQRALIARSLAQDTGLLVMDEPTAFLDLPGRYNIVSLLRRLTREKGKCVIYSTHDLDTAINEADRIWLMTSDSIYEGAPEDLMLSKTLAKAFESPLLAFSQTTGTFSFIRQKQTGISVGGSGMARKLTERALHRSGFRTDHDAMLRVEITEGDKGTEWLLLNGSSIERYSSLYELVNHLPDEDPD
jgi:iron complex transport system ATP-binding protein